MTNITELKLGPFREKPLVLFVAFPGMCMLDMAGPQTVFSTAAKHMEKRGLLGYERHTISEDGGLISSLEGTTFDTLPLAEFSAKKIDTIIVPGAPDIEYAVEQSKTLVEWLGLVSGTARRTASVCNGSFFLVEAGLLKGRRATTHWTLRAHLMKNHPSIEIDRDPIFDQEDKIFTSLGATAGIDLSLELIQADCGRELALEVARELVVF